MASDMQNSDGQYIPLGYPAQTNASEQMTWTAHNSPGSYLNYGLHYPDPHLDQPPREQLTNFIHQEASSVFDNFQKNVHIPEYNNYNLRSNSAPQAMYNYSPNMPENILHNPINHSVQPSQIFENLVGNWAVPNNAGTYTPFGNTDTFKPSLFDFQSQNGESGYPEQKNDIKYKQTEPVDDKFNFNRDTNKKRPLAEVKPMRPSYSDVLTKPVPSTSNTKPLKPESKDVKFKKESRKNGKTDKSQKVGNLLNRCNTNNDIRDIPMDRTFPNSKVEKKTIKTNQLNRKWASLDNISEPNLIKTEESKKIKRPEENSMNNKPVKPTKNKVNKSINSMSDEATDTSTKAEAANVLKSTLKKNKNRQKQNDSFANGNDRPSSKRNQRAKKKDSQRLSGIIGQHIKVYTKRWWDVFTVFILWLYHLIYDIFSLSIHLGRDFAINLWKGLVDCWHSFTSTGEAILKRWRLSAWIWQKFEDRFKGRKKKKSAEEETNSFLQNGLETNINMPTTGEEAMKRLLACKGKDPYSILGVTPKCTDDDIKKYYKRQAVLVHPDKNNQPGAEEAFKILVHAFEMIGTSERRAAYDRGVAESAFVVQNFSQMAELLQKLQQKMEMNANTIRCSACGERHKRIKVDRPCYAARNCHMCKIHHAAREGDIWAEARCFGFLWHYYACMEGSVYDITDWAGCQKDTLKHLKPDSHHVQYRIALGKQNNQPRRNSSSPRMDKPDLENLLNSLYGNSENGTTKRKTKNRK